MIIYVHGALSTRRSFSYISQSLGDVALPQHYFGYDVRITHAPEIVDALVAFVRKLDPQGPLIFISHSYGGIMSVDAARALSPHQSSVISMASPYGGSTEASFLKLLKPSSKLLSNIGSYHAYMRSFGSKPLPCRVMGLVTTAGGAEWTSDANDGVVTVASQLHFEADPNWSGVKLEANHFEVLLLPEAVGLIKKELDRFTALR